MKKIILVVGNMTCPSCLETIQTALTGVAGVSDVSVLFNAGKVKAQFDPSVIDGEQIAQVVTDLGYTVTKMTVKDLVPAA